MTRPTTQPGLDLTAMTALRAPRFDEATIHARIADHLEQHEGYVAFSGGKDSTVVVHLARQADPAVPVVWHDSGLEFPETRTYIEQLADAWNLNLHIETPTPNLLDILHTTGLYDMDRPTINLPSLHEQVVQKPAAHAHTLYGPGELWGVRAAESAGRRIAYFKALHTEIATTCTGCCTPTHTSPTPEQRAHHGGTIRRLNGTTAYGPIWDWPNTTVYAYHHRHNIPLNPLYPKLERLGVPERNRRVNCILDTTLLERGRITWLQRGWPTLYNALAEAFPRIRDYA